MAIGTGAAVEVLAILSPHLHRAFATHTRLTQLRCQNAELCQSVRSHWFSSDQLWLQMDDCSRRAALREQSLIVDMGYRSIVVFCALPYRQTMPIWPSPVP